jgi:hypothetical protein
MGVFLGWALLLAAVGLFAALFRRRPAGEAGLASAGPVPAKRLIGAGAVACLLLGGYLVIQPRLALANRRPVDLSHSDDWLTGGAKDAFRWHNGQLKAKLVVESDSYAAFPVDWQADAFHAEWDMTVMKLDLRPEWGERASIAIGVFDTAAANIDDPDHVSGSSLEACFSDDIRLRASDADRLLKTHSSTELSLGPRSLRKFQPAPPVPVELNVPYHCVLDYDGPSDTATLSVSQGGRVVVRRWLDDLREFTPAVAWFGVTVRGFKHRNKQMEAKLKSAYTKPAAELTLENLRYAQP